MGKQPIDPRPNHRTTARVHHHGEAADSRLLAWPYHVHGLVEEERVLQGLEDVADERDEGCIVVLDQRQHWACVQWARGSGQARHWCAADRWEHWVTVPSK